MRLSLILETNLALIANKLSISPDKLQELLIDADPTNGKYKDYIVKLLLNKNIRLPEDNHRVRETLFLFHTNKRRLPVKDINRYKTLHELETAIEQHQGTSKRQGGLEINPFSLPGVEVHAKQGKYTTLKITNPDSLAELGEGTKWCTRKSYPDCQAKGYINDYNYILIILEGNRPIIQYTPDYAQIMDRNDEEIQDKELLQKLIPRPPLDSDAVMLADYAINIIDGRWPEAEHMISKHADAAFVYAAHAIGGRFEQGEQAIAKDRNLSYHYAMDVVQGRFPLGEPAIARNAFSSYSYALNIIGGRFILGEPAILDDFTFVYHYAKDVIKGRWLEAEPILAKVPREWHRYAMHFGLDFFNPPRHE